MNLLSKQIDPPRFERTVIKIVIIRGFTIRVFARVFREKIGKNYLSKYKKSSLRMRAIIDFRVKVHSQASTVLYM